jgi:O-antigen/teichoic acid export membrane protein
LNGAPQTAAEIRTADRALFRRRLADWTKILSAYFTAQTVTQLLGIGAGLVFIRFMPVREFALYTLAASVLSFFTFVSDLGSTTSLVHFFQRTNKEGGSFPSYLGAVLSLRRGVFLVGCAGVLLLFPRAAATKGFELPEALAAAAAVLVATWFQISASVRLQVLRLAGRFGLSYRAEMTGAALRLLLALVMAATALLYGWLGMAAAAAGTVAVAWLARSPAPLPETEPATEPGFHRRQVVRYLLPTLPSALYFAIQGPLTIWLAATFGGVRNIAEVGALGRLGLVVGIFSSLTGVVFLPRLAQVLDDGLYRRRCLQFAALLLGLALGLFAAAAVAPGPFLLLLGPHYAGLHRELLLVVAGAGLTLLDGYFVSVNLARSWTRLQGFAVGSLIVSQALMVALLPLSTTSGVLTFNLLGSAVALGGQLAITWLGFTRPRWVHWR